MYPLFALFYLKQKHILTPTIQRNHEIRNFDSKFKLPCTFACGCR